MKKEKLFLGLIFLLVFLVIIFPEIPPKVVVPESFYIEVKNLFGERVSGAFCRANVTTETWKKEEIPLYEISNFEDYLSSEEFFGVGDKGYYKLETGLTKKDKTFEIDISCLIVGEDVDRINMKFNHTNILCEIKEDYVIC